MKLFSILFIVAVFFGMTHSAALADPVDFHLGTLDPTSCTTNPAECTLTTPLDPTFAITFSAQTCLDQVPPITGTAGMFGCFKLSNQTSLTVTSLDLSIETAPLGDQPFSCSAAGPFDDFSCTLSPDGTHYLLDFFGGTGVGPTQTVLLEETGANPADFIGTGTVNLTPEPDSLLLLSTGTIMAFLSRRKLFASRRG